MASGIVHLSACLYGLFLTTFIVKLPKPKDEGPVDGDATIVALPQTLVRIPMQHIQPASDSADTKEDESGIR